MKSALIHDTISTSLQFLALSDAAGLLLMLAWAHCDDYGRIKASPAHWAIKVAPGRKNVSQIAELLGEIEANIDSRGDGPLTRYEVDGEEYYYVTKWWQYQGYRHDYTLRAVCPHPLLGEIEPPVTAKTIRGFFGDMAQVAYNQEHLRVQAFLEQGKAAREKPDESRETGDESREQKPHSRGNRAASSANRAKRDEIRATIAREFPETARGSRENSPSSAPAPAPASASTPASASAPSCAARDFGSFDSRPDPGRSSTSLTLGGTERIGFRQPETLAPPGARCSEQNPMDAQNPMEAKRP